MHPSPSSLTGSSDHSLNPRISIVTPSLNMGKYIEDAILSVSRQNYPDFEHLIIDGCSRDNTAAIVGKYPHVKFVCEPDKGQSDALNKGFRLATGDLVGWLNADEYYLPGALHKVAETAAHDSRTDVFYSDSLFVDELGMIQRARTTHRFDIDILTYYGCIVPTDAVFFRRRIFEDSLFIDPDYRVVMDFEYFTHLARAGKRFRYVPGIAAAFRWTGTNASLQDRARRMERLKVQRKWSPLKLPDIGYDMLARLYLGKRVLLKLANGNYRRELQVLRMRNQGTRWFVNESDKHLCESFVDERSRPLQAA